jgi:hypothetical protein
VGEKGKAMTEYGLFNDEGCVEAGFYAIEEAEFAIRTKYSGGDELSILEVCREHDGEPKSSCQNCE